MKEFFAKYKNIALVIIIALAGYSLYSAFFAGRGDRGSLLSTRPGVSEEDVLIGKEFLTTLLELRSLDLDESIFSDESFTALEDFSQEVEPQPAGRPNPFREIGSDPVILNVPEDTSVDDGV